MASLIGVLFKGNDLYRYTRDDVVECVNCEIQDRESLYNEKQHSFLKAKIASVKEEIDSLPDYNSSEKFLDNTPCSYLLEQMIEKIDIK